VAFDELAAIIVVQRLNKHRLNAGLASYDQFSRGRFGKVELVRVPVLCVISLDARHNQPYLRNLVRRLRRQRATAAHLIIEVAIGDNLSREKTQGRAIASASSFRDPIDAAVAAARLGREPAGTSAPQAAVVVTA
jgi:hypothetical protein